MRDELTGKRDLAFSRWHRETFGEDASAIDVDLVGWCRPCGEPLYAVESTRQAVKSTFALNKMADRMEVPAFLVQYQTDGADGPLLDLQAYAAAVDRTSGRRRFLGHATELAAIFDHLRQSHRCAVTP